MALLGLAHRRARCLGRPGTGTDNVWEEDDEINTDPDNTILLRTGAGGGGTGGGGQQQLQQRIPGVPEYDRNDPILGWRGYRLQDTLNQGDLTSFELNKTIRLKPRHYGSVVEPFIGVRYMKFNDLTRDDDYRRFDDSTQPPTQVIPPFLQIIVFSIAAALVGTWVGKLVIDRISEALFRRVFRLLVTVTALRLMYTGLFA